MTTQTTQTKAHAEAAAAWARVLAAPAGSAEHEAASAEHVAAWRRVRAARATFTPIGGRK